MLNIERTEWTRFPKAPIKEAVLDIRVQLPPNTNINQLSNYQDKIRD